MHHTGLGPAECFAVKGKDVESGKLLLPLTPWPDDRTPGARDFPSGTLEVRDVKQIHREDVFKPPVKPTQLPNG